MTGSLPEQSCTEAESDEARQNAEAEKAASTNGTGVPASVRGECMRREHLIRYTNIEMRPESQKQWERGSEETIRSIGKRSENMGPEADLLPHLYPIAITRYRDL